MIDHPVNKLLLRYIEKLLLHTAQAYPPFCSQTTHGIYNAVEKHKQGKPLSINETVILLQLQLLNKSDAEAHIQKQNPKIQALNQQELAHHCSNLSLNGDSNSAQWLKTLSEVAPKTVEQVCVEHSLQLLNTKQLTQLEAFLSPPQGVITLAPQLLSNNQIR